MDPLLFAVIGDVHHQIELAAEGLSRIESELSRPFSQVFSVGDLGLFLDEGDWEFLTGPKKYRTPEATPRIREAWEQWRWPLSAVAGNHEPFNRLRDWDASYFSFKLQYTDAGELAHSVPALRVVGLSGIFHPQETDFITEVERKNRRLPRAGSWPEMVRLVKEGKISRSRLTYYKEFEVQHIRTLGYAPQLLLLHDWPVAPAHIARIYQRRPEAEIVAAREPKFVCCGHHHTAADFKVGTSRVLALNIVTTKELSFRHTICPGWCALFEWDGESLAFLHTWPPG